MNCVVCGQASADRLDPHGREVCNKVAHQLHKPSDRSQLQEMQTKVRNADKNEERSSLLKKLKAWLTPKIKD